MTLTAVEGALRPGSQASFGPEALDRWAVWLAARLDPDWRPGEWFASDLLFKGDPLNPLTRVNVCRISNCGKPTKGKLWCTQCERAARKSGLTPEEFTATYVAPADVKSRNLGGCLVPECARNSNSLGLCQAHYQRWSRDRGRTPDLVMGTWLVAQSPLQAREECPVLGCHSGRRNDSVLCGTHFFRWDAEVRRRREAGDPAGEAEDQAGWIDRQTPLMDMGMFSLAPLSRIARLEVLHVLQVRDQRGQSLPPVNVRAAVQRLVGLPDIVTAGSNFPDFDKIGDVGCASILRQIQWNLAASFDEFRGIDPTRKLIWDLRVVGQRIPSLAPVVDRVRLPGLIDFGEIRQEWLRELVMHFGRTASPRTDQLRRAHRAAVIASRALDLLPGGGHAPGTLGYSDMNAVVEGFKRADRLNGTPYKSKQASSLLGQFFSLLEFGRLEGQPEDLSSKFARHRTHKIKVLEDNEDEIGKSLPEAVIQQLDDHVDLFGEASYGGMPTEVVQAMFTTAYILLRDSGRRPLEIAALSVNCLEFDEGEYQLIWDNRKGYRLRRRLPIPSEAVNAVQAWLKVRATLDLPEASAAFLFPARTARKKHLNTTDLWRYLNDWVNAIPLLESEEIGPDGHFLPFDRAKIFPYAFRHSFCQRYADAGVPLHVLQDLMDHRSAETTGSYYKISNKMKRAAMETLRLQATDRHGDPSPIASANSYMVGAVAVHYGNCIEPSNVKAGGHACPIRYQCSGCPSFRPDPSHLPAIEDHVRTLKSNKELAEAMGAADYTITGMAGEIGDYQQVIVKMRTRMEAMTDEERAEVEEASRVLRRLRAASASRGPVALPMPLVRRRDGGGT